MRYLYYIIISALLLISCNNTRVNNEEGEAEAATEQYAPGTRELKIDFDPQRMTSLEDYNNAMEHYWDNFDFECGEQVIAYDTMQVMSAFAQYASYLGAGSPPERCDSLLRNLMHRAEHSRPVFDFFTHIAECVLHDPNSPLHNDELYIPILEVMVASPLLDEYDRIVPAYDLELALKNRIGEVAEDIVYTLANGRQGRLHAIDSDYTIVMFSNPGCPMCGQITADMSSSPLISELLASKRLTILCIYPDADLETWHNHHSDIPSSWINAYDEGMKITENRTYNLAAIPSLYLLDRQKRVIIKDGFSVANIERTIIYIEQM